MIFFGDVAQTEGEYEYGQNINYRATGNSYDWARGGAGIKYVLVFGLPGVRLHPAAQVYQTGEITNEEGLGCNIIMFVGRLLDNVQCGRHGPAHQEENEI